MGTPERQWFARVPVTSSVEQSPSYSLYLSLGEWPRTHFTVRVNDPSKLARSLSRDGA